MMRKKLKRFFFQKTWKHDYSQLGSTKSDSNIIQKYIDGIKSQVDVSGIKSRKFRVVLDLGNGAQSITAIKTM